MFICNPMDPNLFIDDDSRVYLYWGCSSVEPLYGVELDPDSMRQSGKPTALFTANDEDHGYERPGNDHVPSFTPEEIEQRYQGLLYFRKIDPSTLTDADGAVGYNVLWGHEPDKLYHSCLTFNNKQTIGAPVKGQSYYVRVDAFNEAGIIHGPVTAL